MEGYETAKRKNVQQGKMAKKAHNFKVALKSIHLIVFRKLKNSSIL